MECNILIILILAVLISVLLCCAQSFNIKLFDVTKTLVSTSIYWAVLLFSLILSFSIFSFYSRYINIRSELINSAANLQVIYLIIKSGPPSPEATVAIDSIIAYSSFILKTFVHNSSQCYYDNRTSYLYNKMNDDILAYTRVPENVNIFSNNILDRLDTDQKLKLLISDTTTGEYFILIMCVCFVLIMILFSLIVIEHLIVKLILFAVIVAIMLLAIYLIIILNNPFLESPIQLNVNMYRDLILLIEGNNVEELKEE